MKRGGPEVLLPHKAVVVMRWTNEQRAFAVEAYFCNGHSVVATQRAFRTRFNIHPAGPVPRRQSIVSWVDTFRESGSVAKKAQEVNGLPELKKTSRG